jgi:hypothetical protein
MRQTAERPFTHVCKKCGHLWFSVLEEPTKCAGCDSRNWNNNEESREIYIPIPVFDHSEKKRLKSIGSKCPYCNGTTGVDGVERVAFCYSCDAVFDIIYGEFIGVKAGIGVR